MFRATLVPADAGRRRAVVARRERVKTATHSQFKPSLLPMNQPLGNERITTTQHTSKNVEVLPNIIAHQFIVLGLIGYWVSYSML